MYDDAQYPTFDHFNVVGTFKLKDGVAMTATLEALKAGYRSIGDEVELSCT